MRTDWIRAWWAVVVGVLLIAALLASAISGVLNQTLVQTCILGVTALIVLWYTVETMRLRREAEARAARDREPRINFDVIQKVKTFSASDHDFPLGFKFENLSSNLGLACVRVRLRLDGMGAFSSSNPAYNGEQVWEITPYFGIVGAFDIAEIIHRARREARDNSPHFKLNSVLNVQVDLYGPDRELIARMKREYCIRHHGDGPPQNNFIQFFPEILTSLPELPAEHKLPGKGC